jgi:hypothetical protein
MTFFKFIFFLYICAYRSQKRCLLLSLASMGSSPLLVSTTPDDIKKLNEYCLNKNNSKLADPYKFTPNLYVVGLSGAPK